MNAGQLRCPCQILQNLPTAKDAAGAPVPNWIIVAKVWTEIKPLGAHEVWQGQQATVEATHRVRMHWQPIVKPQMRIQFESRIFEVNSVVDVDERHIELVAMCKELVNG
jgi:SPP1 family predicted phage head-tail adaptor